MQLVRFCTGIILLFAAARVSAAQLQPSDTAVRPLTIRCVETDVIRQNEPVPCPRRSWNPLFVVDGLPLDTAHATHLSDVDPDDIEAVEIVQRATAVEILGPSAVYGAVLITTKKSPIKCRLTSPDPEHIECRADPRRWLIVLNGIPLDNDSSLANAPATVCFDQRDLLKREELTGSHGGPPITLISLRQPRTHPCGP